MKGLQFEKGCNDLSNVNDGIYNDLCETRGTSYEGIDLYVVNGKLYEITKQTPRYAFSCDISTTYTTDNKYPSHSEAAILAQLSNGQVYTPKNSFPVEGCNGNSTTAEGRSNVVNIDGSITAVKMYLSTSRNTSLSCSPYRTLVYGNNEQIFTPNRISSMFSQPYYGTNENMNTYNRACEISL